MLTFPHILTLGGEMQKILFFLSLLIAKVIPIDRAVGSAGGTVIVIRSKLLKIISYVSL